MSSTVKNKWEEPRVHKQVQTVHRRERLRHNKDSILTNPSQKMISRILAQLVGREEKDSDVAEETDNCANLLEFDDGEWVIIKMHENQSLGSADTNSLENLLIEHPSMSVYQMRHDQEEPEETEDMARPVPIRRHVSWRLAAWGSPLPCSTILLSVQRARVHNEHRKLTRGALNRQNLARTRYSPSERHYGFFKQPTQRLYNY